MSVVVDTSAYFALADASDRHHAAARRTAGNLLSQGRRFTTNSYVVVETAALIQARLGLPSLQQFRGALAATTTVVWVEASLHEAAWDELERLGRRGVSLVDCSLAVAALREGITDVFAFDPHFELWGLRLLTTDE